MGGPGPMPPMGAPQTPSEGNEKCAAKDVDNLQDPMWQPVDVANLMMLLILRTTLEKQKDQK